MALLFSAVTVTAGYDEAEFTVGGIPREYDDLVGWTAFDDFMKNVDAETEVSVSSVITEIYVPITVSAPAATLRISIICSKGSARTLSVPPSCFPMRTRA